MTTKAKGKTPTKVRAPKRGEFGRITPGEEYEVLNIRWGPTRPISFDIMIEDRPIYCLFNGCAHLNGRNWIITQRK